MTKARRKSTLCFNCETPLTSGENFCPNCGQENHSRQASTKLLIQDFIDTYLSFDSKLFMTVTPLIFGPGTLTKEYLDGKRVKFVPPIRLFIFLSFLYFGISVVLGDGNGFDVQVNDSGNMAQKEFTALFQRNVNLMIMLFVPLHALIVMLFFRSNERKFYVNFFVFTLHLFSFLFVLGIIMRLVAIPLDAFISDENIHGIVALTLQLFLIGYLLFYSIKALKVTFEKSHTILRFIATLVTSIALFSLTFIAYIFLLVQFVQVD